MTTIGHATITISTEVKPEVDTLDHKTIEARELPVKIVSTGVKALHTTQVMLIANTTNWRKVIKDLIGDEPVSYSERSKRDTLRKRPIINISSEDPEALKRIQSKAAEVE